MCRSEKMNFKNYSLYLLVAIVALGWLLVACGEPGLPMESQESAGEEVSFVFRLGKIAADILTRVEVVVTAANMDEIRKELTIEGNTVSGSVRGIPAGSSRLFTLNGYDADGRLQYRGEATVDLVAGETASVQIAMSRVSSASLPWEISVSTPGDTEHKMVLIPEGQFTMGSEEGDIDEQPVHQVFLDAYYIDIFEVTREQFQAFVQETGRTPVGYEEDRTNTKYPITGVFWLDAKAYCEWAGLRLPTEAEWEKAARGTDGRMYPFGSVISSTNANYSYDGTLLKNVGSYPTGVSPYGVYDMAGNAWEWVADWYDPDYYASSPEWNPQGPVVGSGHVLRGGSCFDHSNELRSSNRNGGLPSIQGTGFRCAQGAFKIPQ